MFRLAAAVLLLAVVPTGFADAEDAPSIAEQIQKVTQRFTEGMREQGITPARRAELGRERTAALAELIKDAKPSTSADYAALANSCFQVGKFDEAMRNAGEAVKLDPKNEFAWMTRINAASTSGKLDDAEKLFAEAQQALPDSRNFLQLHATLYYSNLRARKYDRAAEHMATYLDAYQKDLTRQPTLAQNYLRFVDQLHGAYKQANKPDQALADLDARVKALKDMQGEKEVPSLASALAGLASKRLELLAAAGKSEEALAGLANDLAKAQAALDAQPEDRAAITQMIRLRRLQSQLSTALPNAKEVRADFLEFLNAQFRKHADAAEIANEWSGAQQGVIYDLMRGQKSAEAAEAIKQALASLDAAVEAKPQAKAGLDQVRRNLKMMESRIVSELARAELIGKPAFPIEGATWLNGTSLTDADLKGKVVLLDFWAVWCGPCIATFPHLREWQEKLGPRGLEIIGVTHRYSYDWDDEAKRIKRAEALAPAEEDAATVKFAAHHQLKHRMAVLPTHDLSQQYGVTGIPQAVVIDRGGVIRLIRVGSGESNAKDIELMLEKLLAESATPAGG